MSYVGQSAPIPFGTEGLKTDIPMTTIPPNAAIKANNITLTSSRLEKSKGSTAYNAAPLADAIVSLFDWFPTAPTQRLIALTADGQVWRDTGNSTFSGGTPIVHTPGPLNLGTLDANSHMCAGGAEVQAGNRKLFIFSNGNEQIQVIDGDAATFRDITNPSADWATSDFPTYGLVVNGYFAVLGCSSNPHTLYFSKIDDHETFNGNATDNPLFTVFPGEGDGLVSATVYKGRLFMFKKPYGIYYLETDGSNLPSDWYPKRLSDAFGVGSPHAFCQILDDLVTGNIEGGITSMQATQAFGDIKAGDVLTNALVEEYIRTQIDPSGIKYMHSLYYNEKKKAYFSGRSKSGSPQNRMIVIDAARQTPRITIETKDQPTCLALRKDNNGILRPIYGADDGHVYLLDQPIYNVGGVAYMGEYQTPYIDFSYLDASLASKNKLFDFIEVHYVTAGNWDLNIDVNIDNKFSETVLVPQSGGAVLDQFVLDTDKLAVEFTQIKRLPLHGTGRTISFRFWNNQVNQFFKIEKIVVNFRIGGEQDKGISGVYRV